MANKNCFTPEDVLASVEKYGEKNILIFDLENYRDLKQRNKNSKNDCTYVDIKFNHIDGEPRRIAMKFRKVICASRAKYPHKVEKANATYLNIAFREMIDEDIRGGDYAPRSMSSNEEQEIEKERVNKNIEQYVDNTNLFVKALIHLNNAYEEQSNIIKNKKKSEIGFTIKKNKKAPSVTIFPIVQRTITDEDENEQELKNPMVRVKLMADPSTKKIGHKFWNSETKSHIYKPNVYDLRKMSRNNNKSVLAKVKVGKKLKSLDLSNAGSFITYKSLIAGIIEMPQIKISTFGISLVCKFKDLYVRRHKSNQSEPLLTVKDVIDMNDGEITDEESDDAVMEEEEEDEKDDQSDIGSSKSLDDDSDVESDSDWS